MSYSFQGIWTESGSAEMKKMLAYGRCQIESGGTAKKEWLAYYGPAESDSAEKKKTGW